MAARLTADKEAGPAEFEPQLVGPVIVTYLQGLWRMALVSCDQA
jgi:TetR/AcrR family transcriptional repressor of nem operon